VNDKTAPINAGYSCQSTVCTIQYTVYIYAVYEACLKGWSREIFGAFSWLFNILLHSSGVSIPTVHTPAEVYSLFMFLTFFLSFVRFNCSVQVLYCVQYSKQMNNDLGICESAQI
jgi:hypothetical protein